MEVIKDITGDEGFRYIKEWYNVLILHRDNGLWILMCKKWKSIDWFVRFFNNNWLCVWMDAGSLHWVKEFYITKSAKEMWELIFNSCE